MTSLKSTITLAAAVAAASISTSAGEITCTTLSACDEARQDLEIPVMYNDLGRGEDQKFPNKGCYQKNGKAFWSEGTYDEMSTTDLPELISRIWCEADSNDFVDNLLPVLDLGPGSDSGGGSKKGGDKVEDEIAERDVPLGDAADAALDSSAQGAAAAIAVWAVSIAALFMA